MEMKVPLLDLKAQFITIEDKIREAIDGVMASQRFIMGPEVKSLEEEIASYVGAAYAVGVASGSDAILISLMALGIGSGDAVVTSPFSFFATAGSVTRAGAVPIFCDIDPVTFNIDPEKLEETLNGLVKNKNGYQTKDGLTVKAVMPVHLFGQTADMKPIEKLIGDFGFFMIEDAAQAIGASYDGERAGSFGDLGCFSFFPSKNLGAFGDGGMVTTQNEALKEKLMILRDHGSNPKYYHKFVGINSRLDAIQAAVLRVKLRHLDKWSEGRRKNAEIYKRLFSENRLSSADGPIVPPSEALGRYHIYNQFVIRAKERDRLRDYLSGAGIGTEIYYPVPLHLQECYIDLGYKKGDFPVSEKAAETTLALPVYSELTEDMIQYVVEKIKEFYGGKG